MITIQSFILQTIFLSQRTKNNITKIYFFYNFIPFVKIPEIELMIAVATVPKNPIHSEEI